MEPIEFMLNASDGARLCGYHWAREDAKAVVVIVHGMAEHARRYGRFAEALGDAGFAVVSMDLRGHGRTAQGGTRGWFARKDGWRLVLEDVRTLTRHAQREYPGLPVVLFGHSMGSIFARAALTEFGGLYRCAVLSGVTVDVPGRRAVAPLIAGLAGALQGRDRPSKLLDGLTFGAFNKQFEPGRTRFDWLSRDAAEVDKYVDDEDCGFVCTASMFRDISLALLETLKPGNTSRIPKDVPVLIVSGSEDPAGGNGAAARYLERTYRQAGLDVRATIYEKSRHELLNDINRDEVTADILAFIRESL